ncbi:hypothetical protein I0C86_29475 [Plantactinospora sp. S1510]|uniref:Uncharacterized protein n=1 Tax=Plantactinospora alkalitolerans TaxID=2789879 RepID=A0ABS0H3M7_9ACTN|nr:hypothetical protein [Plantactinospora alkalitolerans]MBF9133061.1 hypothetical protein [Plantactinospora alkalitolerans]
MTRLLRRLTGPRPYHRRNWRQLWRYCRCGWRWRCPDSIELVPAPYRPPPPPRLTETERAEIRALSATQPSVTPDPPPPPSTRVRVNNRGPEWDLPTRSHLVNGRAGGLGALTPAREYRTRPGARM